jgi:hypothetical protein
MHDDSVLFSSFLVLLILLTVSATIHDSREKSIKKEESHAQKINAILHCFSLKKNLRSILSTEIENEQDNFPCLHGIRFVMMAF